MSSAAEWVERSEAQVGVAPEFKQTWMAGTSPAMTTERAARLELSDVLTLVRHPEVRAQRASKGDGHPSRLLPTWDYAFRIRYPDFGCASAVSFEGRFAATSG